MIFNHYCALHHEWWCTDKNDECPTCRAIRLELKIRPKKKRKVKVVKDPRGRNQTKGYIEAIKNSRGYERLYKE